MPTLRIWSRIGARRRVVIRSRCLRLRATSIGSTRSLMRASISSKVISSPSYLVALPRCNRSRHRVADYSRMFVMPSV